MRKNELLLFGNLNIKDFIKTNKYFTKDDIIELENWFNNNKQYNIKTRIKKDEQSEKNHYINEIIINIPTSDTGNNNKDEFKFIKKKIDKHWFFKEQLNQIKKQPLGFLLNENMQHTIIFEILFNKV